MFPIILLLIYVAATSYLSYLGKRRTSSYKSFAVGNKDMGVFMVVIALSASFTSSAMLVIMPGYIYFDGVSGIIYLMVSQQLGLLCGLLVVGTTARRRGVTDRVYSLPHWFRNSYRSPGLGKFFALQSLLLITYMVLIVVAIGYMLSNLIDVPYPAIVVAIVIFVFGYSLLGGSYAHSYTNALQGSLMLIIVLFIFFKALPAGGEWKTFVTDMRAVNPDYFSVTNSGSYIFSTKYEVFFCAFLLGFSNMFQPHIFNKALYLKKEASWSVVALISFVVMTVFNLVLVVGLFARMRYPDIARPDIVMSVYLAQSLEPWMFTIVAVTIVAAAMSTLDGVIVGMSTMLSGELFSGTGDSRKSLRFTRLIIILIGAGVIALSVRPINFIGIYGMWGFNMLMSAAFAPMVYSLWMPRVSKGAVLTASITALVGFVALMLSGITINPAFVCGITIPASFVTSLAVEGIRRWTRKGEGIREV